MFLSDVTPPPPQRASAGQRAGHWLLGLAVVAGLIGAVVIGRPALATPSSTPVQQSQASQSAQGH
ncbi:hypothetical protein [Streptomyces sp. NK08204]|uniref:hypothetical protein n=1 Tax=Streptomyces sp. NK08204 TaxID=2873260 RepID=UPI001CED6933|nr:hypothetical protein [Streptomyces sp. NK08204]